MANDIVGIILASALALVVVAGAVGFVIDIWRN